MGRWRRAGNNNCRARAFAGCLEGFSPLSCASFVDEMALVTVLLCYLVGYQLELRKRRVVPDISVNFSVKRDTFNAHIFL